MQRRQLSPWNWFKKENENKSVMPSKESAMPSMFVGGHPLFRMQHEMERLFDEVFGRTPSGTASQGSDITTGFLLSPQLDISENDEQYTVKVEVPGVEAKDLKLEIDGDTLTISGEKRNETEDKKENFHQIERSFGRFQRVLTLPSNASTENVSADFKNGILTVAMQKHADEHAGRRKIDIKSA